MELLTILEIADKLGIPYRTAQQRLRRKGIKPDEVKGNSKFYDPSVVDEIN